MRPYIALGTDQLKDLFCSSNGDPTILRALRDELQYRGHSQYSPFHRVKKLRYTIDRILNREVPFSSALIPAVPEWLSPLLKGLDELIDDWFFEEGKISVDALLEKLEEHLGESWVKEFRSANPKRRREMLNPISEHARNKLRKCILKVKKAVVIRSYDSSSCSGYGQTKMPGAHSHSRHR